MKNTPTWQRRLWRLLDNKKKPVHYRDYNRVNYRLEETLGCEAEFMGFRACVFYYKLSAMMDLEKTDEVLRIIAKEIGYNSNEKFVPLFIEKNTDRLLRPVYKTYNRSNCLRAIREFYDKYAIDTDSFTAEIDELYPRIQIYSSESFPGVNDICVIFSDRNEVVLAPHVIKRLGFMKKSWIYIQVDKDLPVEVVDMKNRL